MNKKINTLKVESDLSNIKTSRIDSCDDFDKKIQITNLIYFSIKLQIIWILMIQTCQWSKKENIMNHYKILKCSIILY